MRIMRRNELQSTEVSCQKGYYTIGSWADHRYHENYVVETAIHEPGAENLFMQQHNILEHQQRVTNEFYDTTGGVDDRFRPKH